MNEPKSIKKPMYIQKLLTLLLFFKPQLNINVYIFYSVVIALFVAKYIKTGNTVGTLGLYIITLIMILGDALDCNVDKLVGLPIILNYFFLIPTLYTLPEYSPKVGLRDNYSKRNGKELYWAEWSPVQQKQNEQLYQVAWNHTIQLNKMADYSGITNKHLLTIFKFISSSVQRYKLTFAKGAPAKYKGVILFSHGRSGTPFLYSSILRCFARNWKILSPQHSQVKKTKYTDMKDIKRFRQIQVKQRADEIIFMANRVAENEEIILMGHSYGGATVLQAYNSMQLSIRKRVSKIILLDPWLFPLTQQVVQDEIVCPILMLANQHFIRIKDVYDRNKLFVKRHGSKLLYICWKNGDHLHQTDMPFVVGNSLRKIKNAGEGAVQLKNNIQAIQMFLDFEKVGIDEIEQFKTKFEKQDLTIEYRPDKWNLKFNF